LDKVQIIEKLFFYIVAFSYLILPLSFLLTKAKKAEVIPLVLAIYGLVCCAVLSVYFELPKDLKKIHHTVYTSLEYVVFAFIFAYNIQNKQIRKLIFWVSILFLIFQLVFLLMTGYTRLDSLSIGVETILVLIYIFFFFYESAKTTTTQYIYYHYCFWIAVGILIYLGGSFFFYILFEKLTKEQVDTFGNLTYLAEGIKNVLFALAMFMYKKHPMRSFNQKQESVPFLDMI